MKKKKYKLKKKIVIPMLLIIIGIVLVCIPYFLINIHLYGDKIMVLDYGEKYSEPGYKGNVLNSDITDNIKVVSNVKSDLGSYNIKYTYKMFIFSKTIERKVLVKDVSGPKITLEGGDNVEVTINTEYKELGFMAVDNLDGDITDSVSVDNNIDTTKLGDYVVNYEAVDKSGNKTTIKRNVKVERLRPTQMSLKDYKLDGWYPDTNLGETKDMGSDYYNSFKIVGDSNIMILHEYGYIKDGNAWAVPCLHAESMFNTDINIYGKGIKIKLLDAVSKYKPERIILYFGSFSTSWIKEETFLKKSREIIDKIKEINPNTEIVLMSIYPIAKKLDNVKFSQDKINKYNFYILEIAHEKGLKFLDVQKVLKGSDGYAASKYISKDGYHLSGSGHSLVRQYIRTHGIEKE